MIDQKRLFLFESVKQHLDDLGRDEFTLSVQTNDALEPTLEVRMGKFVWIVGMMDEPVWGYELEHDDHEDRSWSFVKEASLGLPESTLAQTVAIALVDAIDADLLALAIVQA